MTLYSWYVTDDQPGESQKPSGRDGDEFEIGSSFCQTRGNLNGQLGNICREILEFAQQAYDQGSAELSLALAELAARHCDSHENRLRLAAFQGETGRPDLSLRTLMSLIIEGYPLGADTYTRIGQLEAELGRLDRAITNFYRAILVGGSSPLLWYNLASCQALSRNFEEANRIFASNITLPLADQRETSTRLLRLASSRDEIGEGLEEHAFIRPLAARTLKAARSLRTSACESVLFVCCDSKYFVLFSRALCRSVVEHSGVSIGIHLHVINPDEGAIRLMKSLAQDFKLDVVCTTEVVAVDQLTEEQKKTLYSCMRFLVLPALLPAYEKPVLVTDTDQAVVGDLGSFLSKAREHDVSLLLFPASRWNLLALISATVCVANTTPKAREFFHAVRNYLLARMREPEAMAWHLDQAALAAAYLASPDIDFNLLPPDVLVQRSGQGGLFWSITYSVQRNAAKLKSQSFLSYAAP